MKQLREFAQHKSDFDALHTRVIAISNDSVDQVRDAWDQVTGRQFTFLSDPDLRVIRSYGIVHANARGTGQDIALRTSLLVGADGRERWRIVSTSVFDTPKAQDVLARIRATQ